MTWTFEFESTEHFQEYFVKVYGSSYPSIAERIILFLGLYNLFCECACVVEEPILKNEYRKQSSLCQDNLETLLANLPFHMPSTYDYVLALALAVSQHSFQLKILPIPEREVTNPQVKGQLQH